MNQYDHLRKNLKEYNVPIDKEKLWANTAHAIPKKRKKRAAFFLLPAGALLIGAALMLYVRSIGDIAQNTTPDALSVPVPPTPAQANKTIHTDTHDNLISAVHTEPDQPSNTPQVSGLGKNRNGFDAQANQVKSPTIPIQVHTSENSIATEPAGTQNGNTASQSTGPVERLEGNPALSPAGQQTETTNEAAGNPVALDVPSSLIREPYTSAKVASLPVSSLTISEREALAGKPTATRNRKTNRYNVRIMQGYGLTTLNISTDKAELEPTVEALKSNMKSLENLSTSLHASLRLPKGIQLGAGFQYSKLNTQLEYQQTTTEEVNGQGISEIIIDDQGNVQNLVGDVSVNRQTIIHSTRYTSHTRLDIEGIVSIPVLRSFRHETGVWGKAGYNLMYTSQGTTFGPGDQPVSFSTKDNPYTLASPFTFGIGISTLYRINPHWMVNVGLGYEGLRYTHGLYDDKITFNHSIFSLSLGTGYVF